MVKMKELLVQVKHTTTDFESDYWDESELLDYANEAIRNIARIEGGVKVRKVFNITNGTKNYSFEGIMKYISATDEQGNKRTFYTEDPKVNDDFGILVLNHDELYIYDETKSTEISMLITGMPERSNLEDYIVSGREMAIRYYVLMRCYMKEDDVEQFAKAQYFERMYEREKLSLLGDNALPIIQPNITVTTSYNY